MNAVSNPPVKRKRGRPITYSPDVAAEICRRLSNGETLREICRTPGMPPEATVRGWYLSNLEGFGTRYARAREAQIEAWSDEIVAISQEQEAEPNDRRVRIDTKRWLMSKLVAKRYGDRIVHAGDADAPLHHVIENVELKKLSNPELDALERFCQARLNATDAAEDETSKGAADQ